MHVLLTYRYMSMYNSLRTHFTLKLLNPVLNNVLNTLPYFNVYYYLLYLKVNKLHIIL